MDNFREEIEVKTLTLRDLLKFVYDEKMPLGLDTTLDEVFCEESKWFLDVNRAAEKFREAPAVVNAWIESGQLTAFKYRDAYYIPWYSVPKVNMFKVVM